MTSSSMFPCPVCGAQVAKGRKSCRSCGASDSDGWSMDPAGELADSEDFDYDDYVEREHSSSERNDLRAYPPTKQEKQKFLIWLILAAMALGILLPLLG